MLTLLTLAAFVSLAFSFYFLVLTVTARRQSERARPFLRCLIDRATDFIIAVCLACGVVTALYAIVHLWT